ncbi:MAG TPA: hypothetical protein PLO37_23150 [Candidatus Hydrogenedentes bacterium]|nr:hypothetical protein [Candidatus Hydrogenedentota bacterium]HPG69757.1 hypothetical protein [Candidatus Hydrogenedentota bacterium]
MKKRTMVAKAFFVILAGLGGAVSGQPETATPLVYAMLFMIVAGMLFDIHHSLKGASGTKDPATPSLESNEP